MKVFKRKFVIIPTMLFILVSLIAGCGSNATKTGVQAEEQFTLGVGHLETTTSVTHLALERFKEKVEKDTGGKVKVDIYPASQLGNARAQIESIQIGTLQGVVIPNSSFTGFHDYAAITDLPFLFPSVEIAHGVMDSEVGNEYLKSYERAGISAISMWETGFKMMTSDSEIRTPSDFKGKKFRVMENPILIAQYESLGASAIPINFAELYNSLQQGVVDCQENPPTTIYNMKFHEVQKYLLRSTHGWLPEVFGLNKAWFDKLPKEYQDIIIKAAEENKIWVRQELRRLEEEVYIPTFKEEGMIVIEPTVEEIQAIADKVRDSSRAALNTMINSDGHAMLEKIDAAVNEMLNK